MKKQKVSKRKLAGDTSTDAHSLQPLLNVIHALKCTSYVEFVEKFVIIIEHHKLVAKVPMTQEAKIDYLVMEILVEIKGI